VYDATVLWMWEPWGGVQVRALESNSGMQKADVEDDSKTESLLAESEARAEALRGENVQLQGLLSENEALMAKVSLMRPYPWG